ncbi:hypothetical protein YP76_04855 [Sphingobium chungbukense]|uniref:Uncharacterized protein n=1 Tax=Sphingobium chungbukense TaxID=56193 RepID=A0A0M3AYH1_9SPHN|nr:hypothetical protein YP76_04855 [Sphingobium chungbukense]
MDAGDIFQFFRLHDVRVRQALAPKVLSQLRSAVRDETGTEFRVAPVLRRLLTEILEPRPTNGFFIDSGLPYGMFRDAVQEHAVILL